MKMKSFLTKLILCSMLFVCAADTVWAGSLSIRPFLIDEVVEPRQTLTKDVVLVNQTNHKLNVYATVNEITIGSEGEIRDFIAPIMDDRTQSITSWVEITRGRIELEPGETKTIPLTFRVHPEPIAGEYHAFIGFVPASKRYQAEEAVKSGDADGVVVKLTIEDKSEEFLRISGFLVDRFVTRDNQKVVAIEIENLGDVAEIPKGEIIFFNSTGEEVTAAAVNTQAVSIPPGEKVIIETDIPLTNELGRYKANVSLRYGDKQRAALYDTTQFFMMPLHIMILILVSMIVVALIIFLLLHRALTRYDGEEEEGTDLSFFVRDGHEPNPKDHDIDLSKK